MSGKPMLLVLFSLLASTESCHPDCVTCNGMASNQCESCGANAWRNGSPRGDCLCNPGFYANGNAQNCEGCDPTCASCSGSLSSQCTLCKANASGAPGTCTCATGYFPNLTAAMCSQCHHTCESCSLSGAAGCSVCLPGAGLTSGPPGPCACSPGSVPNPDSSHCTSAAACDYTCLVCALPLDSTQCTSCFSYASPTTNPGSCACDPNTVASPDIANCRPCHNTCFSCAIAGETKQCTACHGLAVLSGSSPSACICPDGTVENPDAASCLQCHQACLLCVVGGEAGCSKCRENAFMSGSPPNSCLCSPGFFASPDPSNCLPCASTCNTCANSTECLSCKANASLLEGQCVCALGTFPSPDASLCVPCPASCSTCLATACSSCHPPYVLTQGACLELCPPAYIPSEGVCRPVDSTPPVPTLTVDITNDLQVSFDKEMRLILKSSDISIEVKDASEIMYQVSWSEPVVDSTQSFYVTLSFNSSVLPADNQVTFKFLSPEEITDIARIPITVSTLTGVLYPFGNSGEPQSLKSSQIASALGPSSVAAGLSSALFSGNPRALWSLINQLELITFIPMSALEIPEELVDVLNSLIESIIPDPFKYVRIKHQKCSDLPHFARKYQTKSSVFLSNARVSLGVGVFFLLLYLCIALLCLLPIAWVRVYCRKRLTVLRWTVSVRWWVQSYLNILVFSCLQLYMALDLDCLEEPYLTVSSVLSLLGLALGIITPIGYFAFHTMHMKEILTRCDDAFNKRWKELYHNIRPNSYSASFFILIFLLRRFIYGLSLVCFAVAPKLQAVLGTSLSFVVLLHLLLCRPLDDRLEWVSECLVECCTFAVFMLSSFYAFELGEGLKQDVQGIAVWTVLLSVALNAALSLLKMIVGVVEVLRQYKHRRYPEATPSLEPLASLQITTSINP